MLDSTIAQYCTDVTNVCTNHPVLRLFRHRLESNHYTYVSSTRIVVICAESDGVKKFYACTTGDAGNWHPIFELLNSSGFKYEWAIQGLHY